MSKGKKYDYRVAQEGETWSAAIIRRVTAKKTAVSKAQDGFASEAEANAWGESELKFFQKNLAERNEAENKKRSSL